jgi:hypothetical protein
MPFLRFDWHQHITEVWGVYRSVRAAVDLLKAAVAATPDLLRKDPEAREYLHDAHNNLRGTYIVRLFATFEAAGREGDIVREQGSSLNSASLTPKPIASSVYEHVPEAPSPP